MQIHWSIYLNHTGYSISAQDYILAMRQVDPNVDIKVHFENKETRIGVSKNRQQIFSALSQTKESLPKISIYQTVPHRYRHPKGSKKNIGVCVFETMNPPKQWINLMNEMDLIIAASSFNKRIFETNGVNKPIHVVPHCFDSNLFNKEVKPNGRYAMTTFLSIGTWKKRKSWETLIKAFYDAFEKKDNVCLLIKTDKPKELESAVQRIKRTCEWRSKDTAPIFAEQKTHCTFEEIPQFMRKGDIFISPTLGEGFGLSGLHAMALGIPVIITKFSGVLEYAKPDLCTYIEPQHYKTYPVMDGIPQFSNCIWPVIRVSQVRDKMLEVWKKYPSEKANAAYKFVHDNFNYEKTGNKFLEAIRA